MNESQSRNKKMDSKDMEDSQKEINRLIHDCYGPQEAALMTREERDNLPFNHISPSRDSTPLRAGYHPHIHNDHENGEAFMRTVKRRLELYAFQSASFIDTRETAEEDR